MRFISPHSLPRLRSFYSLMPRLFVGLLVVSVPLAGLTQVIVAQEQQGEAQKLRANDRLRACVNWAEFTDIDDHDELYFDNKTWGSNPQEGQYRDEMVRLLGLEVENVRRAIRNVEDKYAELIRAKPELAKQNSKELILEDKPGVWRDGQYVNTQKVLALYFDDSNEKLKCAVLDALVQNIYVANQWTRKLMRLYNPHVQRVELHTIRHNYVQKARLERASPEIQLRALRLFAEDLRSSLYMMDMEIAAHYEQQRKVNSWQLGI